LVDLRKGDLLPIAPRIRIMRNASRIASGCLIAVTLAVLGVSAARPSTVQSRGSFTLTTIADIGTVYWRYDCAGRSAAGSLGLTVERDSATTEVHFRLSGHSSRTTMQPGQTKWFPFGRGTEVLSAYQSTEPGTLRAILTVDFAFPHSVPHCYRYAPPRFTLQEYPR